MDQFSYIVIGLSRSEAVDRKQQLLERLIEDQMFPQLRTKYFDQLLILFVDAFRAFVCQVEVGTHHDDTGGLEGAAMREQGAGQALDLVFGCEAGIHYLLPIISPS